MDEVIEFKNRHYRLFDRYYRSGRLYLHREIWKDAHGDIPAGCHIHHKNGDTLDNRIENLELVSTSKHLSDHGAGKPHPWAGNSPGATAWHRSPEGREWHRQHAHDVWGRERRTPQTKTCDYCGSEYSTLDMRPREHAFCSNRCRSAYRRRSRVDDVERTCTVCGATFRADKYSGILTCSRKCGSRSRRDRGGPR